MNDLPEALKYANSLRLFNAISTQRLQEEINLRESDPFRSRLSYNGNDQLMFVKCAECGGNGMTVPSMEAFDDPGFVKKDNLCEACGGTGGGRTPEGNRICIRSKGQHHGRNEDPNDQEFGEPSFEVFTLDSDGYKVSILKTNLEDFKDALRFALAVEDACKEGKKRKERIKKVIPV